MLSQNVEMLNYMNVPESVVISERSIPHGRNFFYKVVTSLMIALVPLLTIYICSCMNAQQEYKMQNLRAEVISLTQENATYKLEVAKLEAPARIQKIAETKLGMQVSSSAIYGRGETRGNQYKMAD